MLLLPNPLLQLLIVLLMLLVELLSPNPLVADIGGGNGGMLLRDAAGGVGVLLEALRGGNTGGTGAGAAALPLEVPRELLLQSRVPLLRGAEVAAGTAGAAGAGATRGGGITGGAAAAGAGVEEAQSDADGDVGVAWGGMPAAPPTDENASLPLPLLLLSPPLLRPPALVGVAAVPPRPAEVEDDDAAALLLSNWPSSWRRAATI